MSITQTYFLAHSARGKLSREAARADHDLRLLVGHANMLDQLMIDLATAEQEQERWFNQSLSGTREKEVTHEDTIVEEPEADWEAEDAESEDESDYEEEQIKPTSSTEVDMEEDDEQDDSLALTRTVSRHSPPELTLDDDSDSDDEHMPPSPPNLSVDTLTAKQSSPVNTIALYPSTKSESLESDGIYLSTRQQPTIIAAY